MSAMDGTNFDRKESASFAEYWQSLRKDELVPAKSRLDPSQLKHLLPYIMIFEKISDTSFLIRLVGTEIVRRRGKDPTGHKLEAYSSAGEESPFRKNLMSVLDCPCGFLTISIETYTKGTQSFIELSGFPFADSEGVPRFIVSLAIESSRSFNRRNKSLLMSQERTTRQEWKFHQFIDIGAGLPEPIIPTKQGIAPVYQDQPKRARTSS